jgi:hypothetical protein
VLGSSPTHHGGRNDFSTTLQPLQFNLLIVHFPISHFVMVKPDGPWPKEERKEIDQLVNGNTPLFKNLSKIERHQKGNHNPSRD